MVMRAQVASSSEQTTHHLDPRRWLMLVVILCATFMGALDTFIVNVAMPTLERELHASWASVQLVIAGYTLAYAVLLVTGGRLGDLYGRKRLFLLGISGFTLFSVLCGFAPSVLWLIVFRVLQGALAALMVPQVIAFIQVNFESHERQRALSGYTATLGLASILGQVLGGALLAANIWQTGWRGIFLVNLPIGIVALFAAVPLLRESRLQGAHRLDYGGVAFLTVSLFLFIFPLVQGGNAGWPWWSLLCLVLTVPSVLLFITYERRMIRIGKLPLISLALFRNRRFTSGILTVLLANALFAALLFLLSFYLQTDLRFTPLQSGLVIMASSVSFIAAGSANPALVRRMGNGSLSLAGALIAFGYLLILLAAQFLVPLWNVAPLLIALFIQGFGEGLLLTRLLHTTLEGVAQQDVGTASGMYTTVLQTAGALGVAVIGVIFTALRASGGSFLHTFVVSLLLLTLLSLSLPITIRSLKTHKQKDGEQTKTN
jgi:EmrB/QacA subfamily drug resistance transporter